MAGYTDAGFGTRHLLNLFGNAVGRGGVAGFCTLGRPFLALHLSFFGGECTLRHGKDGEVLASLGAALHGVGNLLDIVGMFGDEDDIGAARDAGIQCQPSGLVAHHLNAHHAAVAACGGVDAVNDLGCNVHGGMEAERDIGPVDIIVNGLGQADDVEALLAEEVSVFVGAVAAQAEQAVQLGFLVGLFHGGDFVHLVLPHHAHHLERRALGSEDRSADRQDAGKLTGVHIAVIAANQSVIAIHDADDLNLVPHALIEGLGHAADGCVQARAVAARSEDTNTHFHNKPPRLTAEPKFFVWYQFTPPGAFCQCTPRGVTEILLIGPVFRFSRP